MKNKLGVLFLALLAVAGCSSGEGNRHNEAGKAFRIIHNNDGTDLLGNLWFNREPLTTAHLDSAVSLIAGTQVTTFSMCTGSDIVYYRSKYCRIIGDDRSGTLDCGPDTAAFRTINQYYLNHLNLEKEGTDLVRYCLGKAHEKGMETMITYRMNDLHFTDTTAKSPILYPDFWIQHPEYWLHDNHVGRKNNHALDFAHPEVREYKLNIIKEQLDLYGSLIDGYELDFMRFLSYFKIGDGPKNAPLMTELVEKVRAEIDMLSAMEGREVVLGVRVPTSLNVCAIHGLDIREWLKRDLVDFVTIGVHWRGDPSMPVGRFRAELGEDLDVPLYATVDDGGMNPRSTWSHGRLRAQCANILAQGADGINLFNFYFGTYMSEHGGVPALEGEGQVCVDIMPDLLREVGSLETLAGRNKIYSLSDGRGAYRVMHNTLLPMIVSELVDKTAEIFIGDKVEEQKPEEVVLYVRADLPVMPEILVNGYEALPLDQSYVKRYNLDKGIMPGQAGYAYSVPLEALRFGSNSVSFSTETETVVRRMELLLKYGPVETNGWF